MSSYWGMWEVGQVNGVGAGLFGQVECAGLRDVYPIGGGGHAVGLAGEGGVDLELAVGGGDFLEVVVWGIGVSIAGLVEVYLMADFR